MEINKNTENVLLLSRSVASYNLFKTSHHFNRFIISICDERIRYDGNGYISSTVPVYGGENNKNKKRKEKYNM